MLEDVSLFLVRFSIVLAIGEPTRFLDPLSSRDELSDLEADLTRVQERKPAPVRSTGTGPD